MNSRSFFSNESVIKVISLLGAVILWMYVVSINNPEVDITIKNVPIKIANVESIQDNGLEIISVSDEKIDVKISGRVNDVSKVTSDDVTVQLDVSGIYSTDNHLIKPDVEISGNGINVVGTSVDNVNVFVDYISKIEKEITIETAGEPAENYVVTEVSTQNNKVIVSGPQSVVARIDKVKAVIDVSGATKEVKKVSELKIYSADNKEITSEQVKLSFTDISVSATVDYSKTIGIVADFQGLNNFSPDDYTITLSDSEIVVLGEENDLRDLTEIFAVVKGISTDDENVLLSQEWEATLDIPQGVKVKDDVNIITVRFHKK